MPRTRVSGVELKDGSIQRVDLDVTTPGQSVITKVIGSSDISLSSTGFDPGTGDVTIALTDTGVTPGTYTKITLDAKGRATAGASLTISDLPTTGVTPGTWTKVTVNDRGIITDGTSLSASDIPSGSTYYVQNQSAAPQTASIWISGVSAASALRAYEGTGTHYVGIAPPTGLAASYTFKLPASYGSSTQVLAGDGAGNLAWTSLPTSLPPSGSASGDLSGTYPGPTVTGLRGSALPSLGSSALLRYNGSAWVFDANVYLTGNQSITLSGDVAGTGTTSISTTIQAGSVTLSKMANLSAGVLIGNNTGNAATPLELTAAQVKTLLAIATADITNLGSWSGSTSLTTLGTVTTGTWTASTIAVAYGGTGLTSLGTVGTSILGFTSAAVGLVAWSGSTISIDTTAYLPLTAGPTKPLSGNLYSGGVPTYIPGVPLNLVNSAAGAVRTQLSLVNTGGGGGAGSAIDFFTYDVSGGTNPGLRIAGIDNNYSADFVVYTKAPGAAGNALVERFRIANAGAVTVASTLAPLGGIVGVTNASNAAAGTVGEIVTSSVTQGSAGSMTTNATRNVTSISLSAGDWDVDGYVNLVKDTASATLTFFTAGINTASASIPADGTECEGPRIEVASASWRTGVACPRKRISVSSTTTVYLVARTTFTNNTLRCYGSITARRVR